MKFQGKYRIETTRLNHYDYSHNGAYFVTICTHNHIHYFGKIVNGAMQLSDIGNIATACWKYIPDHFSFVNLGPWIIMPNHVHGILMFHHPTSDTPGVTRNKNVGTHDGNAGTHNANVETPKLGVSTTIGNTAHVNTFWKSGNLGVVINQYKRACTIKSRAINPNFAWQSRFYDRIIRNENELRPIEHYIITNPYRWNHHAAQ